MKKNNNWKVYVTMWIAVAIAVMAGIYLTHSAWCLWGFLLPVAYGSPDKSAKDDNEENQE